MKLIISLTFLALCVFANAEVSTRWLNLRLDHFNPLETRTFDMRYFANSDHYIAGGPLFIYIGGGLEVYDEYLTRGAVFDIAVETNGYVFALEHRYFGLSRPTTDTSVENLAFLNIHQTIADIAQFISFAKANYYQTETSRVILFGRGYGGSLATWARQKYPNLIDGVWASSAPLDAVMEIPVALENAANTIASISGPDCLGILTAAFRQLDDAVRLRNTTWVEERFRLCSPIDIDVEEDVSRFFYGVASDVAINFISNAIYPEVDDKCFIMREEGALNDIDAFAKWYVDDFNKNQECLNFNNTAITAKYLEVEWDTISTIAGRRQNFWLQCTQLGQFVTSNSERQPFGWRFQLNFFQRMCAEVFDTEIFTQFFMEEGVSRTNQFFGGLNPHVYRTFFTQGEMDPRRSLGPLENINNNSEVVVMSLQSFGRDFGSASELDYPILAQTKLRARELIIEWLFDAIEEDNPNPTPPVPLAEIVAY